jgi:phospholipase/carboxylesterase
MKRRTFLAMAAIAAAIQFIHVMQMPRGGNSLLHARPKKPNATIAPGEQPLGLGSDRDGLLIVPSGYQPDKAAPLAVMLHGAGGDARHIAGLSAVAGSLGVILLVPESRNSTWDAIRGSFGPDVEFLDRALSRTFDRCFVDRRKIAIGGFSDGATYALSLGLDNGGLFTHVLAFSPGFNASRRPQGRPTIFISHGRADRILPIDHTSRRIVPALENASYPVTYREFDGPHAVPPEIAREGFAWFTK